MRRIALIGANGFVGSSIARAFIANHDSELVAVNRTNYDAARTDGYYDILINAAMPSKRFWAQQEPAKDFSETTEKTFKLVNDWNWGKIIQISSISARSQLNTVYGRNKASAEKLVEYGDNLILRLGPMYGDGLNKGVLVDILQNKTVFVARDSRYCFAPIGWIGEWIERNLDSTGVMDLGANEAITVGEVADAVNSKSQFRGEIDNQVLSMPIIDAPLAKGAIDFVNRLKLKEGRDENN
tara:strand:+ start:151 stop:870 length:720 start_codon:yes stop_codon:yes gene_type:complete